MRFFAPLLALLVLPLPVFAQPITTPRDAVGAMVAAVAAGDATRIAALYAPEAVVLGPARPALAGREAIGRVWAQNLAAGYSALEVADVRTETGADRAAMLFTWQATIAPPGREAQILRGRSLLYLIRAGDGWLISADMWHPAP